MGAFHAFLYCTNGTKSRSASHITPSLVNPLYDGLIGPLAN